MQHHFGFESLVIEEDSDERGYYSIELSTFGNNLVELLKNAGTVRIGQSGDPVRGSDGPAWDNSRRTSDICERVIRSHYEESVGKITDIEFENACNVAFDLPAKPSYLAAGDFKVVGKQ